MEPISTGIIETLGLKAASIVAGAVGAFVSLRFFEGLNLWEKWSTFLGGWALASFLAQPLVLFLEVPSKVESGISLLVGLFGMSLVAAIIRVIRDTKWSSIIQKRGGGDDR